MVEVHPSAFGLSDSEPPQGRQIPAIDFGIQENNTPTVLQSPPDTIKPIELNPFQKLASDINLYLHKPEPQSGMTPLQTAKGVVQALGTATEEVVPWAFKRLPAIAISAGGLTAINDVLHGEPLKQSLIHGAETGTGVAVFGKAVEKGLPLLTKTVGAIAKPVLDSKIAKETVEKLQNIATEVKNRFEFQTAEADNSIAQAKGKLEGEHQNYLRLKQQQLDNTSKQVATDMSKVEEGIAQLTSSHQQETVQLANQTQKAMKNIKSAFDKKYDALLLPEAEGGFGDIPVDITNELSQLGKILPVYQDTTKGSSLVKGVITQLKNIAVENGDLIYAGKLEGLIKQGLKDGEPLRLADAHTLKVALNEFQSKLWNRASTAEEAVQIKPIIGQLTQKINGSSEGYAQLSDQYSKFAALKRDMKNQFGNFWGKAPAQKAVPYVEKQANIIADMKQEALNMRDHGVEITPEYYAGKYKEISSGLRLNEIMRGNNLGTEADVLENGIDKLAEGVMSIQNKQRMLSEIQKALRGTAETGLMTSEKALIEKELERATKMKSDLKVAHDLTQSRIKEQIGSAKGKINPSYDQWKLYHILAISGFTGGFLANLIPDSPVRTVVQAATFLYLLTESSPRLAAKLYPLLSALEKKLATMNTSVGSARAAANFLTFLKQLDSGKYDDTSEATPAQETQEEGIPLTEQEKEQLNSLMGGG